MAQPSIKYDYGAAGLADAYAVLDRDECPHLAQMKLIWVFCVMHRQPACHQVEVAAECATSYGNHDFTMGRAESQGELVASRLRASECSLAQRATSLCYLSISVSS